MPYERKIGDFELRILKDGRLVMIAPDETLLDLATTIGELTQNNENVVKVENDTDE